jgi:23S rRNA (cytosine1962-C5)-methyltransferase
MIREAMAELPNVFLHPRRSGAAIGRHPWVFSGAIERVEGEPSDGAEVAVFGGTDGRFIGYGFHNSKSDIRVRLFSWNKDVRLDRDFFASAIDRAIRLRRSLGLLAPDGASRLIFSESDGISGLVVDRYLDVLVLQVTSLGVQARLTEIVEILKGSLSPKSILVRSSKDLASKEGFTSEDRVLWGSNVNESLVVEEGGISFEIDLSSGQKTGFYLDQRLNRRAAADFAKGKRVLDLYCNQGGFGLHALKAGAEWACGVDSSKDAIEAAQRNAKRNGLNLETAQSDVFEFLKSRSKEQFSMVVVDPPRFVASHDSKERALRKYYKLNTEVLSVLSPEGIFVSCSCSGRVTQEEWISLLSSVAARSKRAMQILEIRGASPDHPVNAHCPETQYLKCVIARVT